jgi:hypothetical protein
MNVREFDEQPARALEGKRTSKEREKDEGNRPKKKRQQVIVSDGNLAAKHVLDLVQLSSGFNRATPGEYGQALLGGIKRLLNCRDDSRDKIRYQLVLWSDEVGYTL